MTAAKSLGLALLVLLLLAVPGLGDEHALVRVEQVMASPPATGLIVTGVRAGSQAAKIGIRSGDVVVAYGGESTPTHKALASAKRVATQSRAAEIRIEIVTPDGTKESLPIAPGPIGIDALPVEKGVSASKLPAATEVHFALDRLAQAPQDEWFGFRFPPGPKIGFEHGRLGIEDGTLKLRREVAFDGGRQWGLNHFDVTVTADAANPLLVKTVTFAAPMGAFESTGKLVEKKDGTKLWRLEWTGRDSESGEPDPGSKDVILPTDLPVVPSYLVSTLASLMTKEKGACLHFRPLSEGDGHPMLRTALFVVGQEEVEAGNTKQMAWRIEQRRAGGQVVGIYWIDDAGLTVRADYGGPVAFRTTKEDATSRVHPDIEIRSTK